MARPSQSAMRSSRRTADARMRGECLIARPGKTITDDIGDTHTALTAVYEGPGYARYPGVAFEQNFNVVDASVVASRLIYRIGFPHIDPEPWMATPPQVRPGDLIRIDSDPDNPQLAGIVLRVASIDDQSQASAQRLLCLDFQAGMNMDDLIWPDEEDQS